MIALVLIFFTPLLFYIPRATLAVHIIAAVLLYEAEADILPGISLSISMYLQRASQR